MNRQESRYERYDGVLASKLVSLLVTLTKKNGYLERENNRLRKRVARFEAESKSHEADEKQSIETEQVILDLQSQLVQLKSTVLEQQAQISGLRSEFSDETRLNDRRMAVMDKTQFAAAKWIESAAERVSETQDMMTIILSELVPVIQGLENRKQAAQRMLEKLLETRQEDTPN